MCTYPPITGGRIGRHSTGGMHDAGGQTERIPQTTTAPLIITSPATSCLAGGDNLSTDQLRSADVVR